MVKKLSLTSYLSSTNNVLGTVLEKINTLQRWNSYLQATLSHEPELLAHCKIVGLNKTALIVIADSANWMTRFRFYTPSLIPKLKKYPDFTHLSAICCKVRPTQHAKKSHKTRQSLHISKKNAALLQETAQKIQDKNIKAILMKIALHEKED